MSSIGSTINSINSSLLSEISSYLSTQKTSGSTTTTNTSDTTSSDRVDFSKVAELFKELKQLQSTDPAELKKVLTEAASKLKQRPSRRLIRPRPASFRTWRINSRRPPIPATSPALQPPPPPGGAYGPPPPPPDQSDNSSDSSSTSADSSYSKIQDLLAAI